ncbi:MAG: hypothetical protein Q4C42_04670 [Clostridia bacterium]|nr:hypothetical protein [Clostridia bacterium]
MPDIEKIAKILDGFYFDYDSYGYNDEYDDRDIGLADIKNMLKAGRVDGYIDWLFSVVNDHDEFEQQALQLIGLLETLRK